MKKYFCLSLLLYVCGLALNSCSCQPSKNIPKRITVAIYPYLPRANQFKSVLNTAWQKKHPDIELQFVDYDCYHYEPPDTLDVFVYDGIFYQYFISKHYVRPILESSIEDWSGFMSFARDAANVNGKLYGIPYTGCSNIYVYRKSDKEFDTLTRNGIDAFYSILGDAAKPQDTIPQLGKGLLVDLSSSSQDLSLYAMAEMNLSNSYSSMPYLSDTGLNRNVISHLHKYSLMAGTAQAGYSDDSGEQRAKWFGQGYGRCLVGYTENLCYLPKQLTYDIKFKILPTADTYLPTTEEFYVDLASINMKVDEKKAPYAMELLNLMTSSEVMYNSMVPDSPQHNPQFLMPVRGKVLGDLMNLHPVYVNMAALLLSFYDKPLLIGDNCRDWLKNNKAKLKAGILNGIQ